MSQKQFSFYSQYFVRNIKLKLIFFKITVLYFSSRIKKKKKKKKISPDLEHRCPSLTTNYANLRIEKNNKHVDQGIQRS